MKAKQNQGPQERFNNAWPRLKFHQRTLLLGRIYWHVLIAMAKRLRQPAAHYIGDQRRPGRRIRPSDLLFPVTISQVIVFAGAAWSTDPIYLFAVGNIMILALAMLPSTWQPQKTNQ